MRMQGSSPVIYQKARVFIRVKHRTMREHRSIEIHTAAENSEVNHTLPAHMQYVRELGLRASGGAAGVGTGVDRRLGACHVLIMF